MQPGGFDLGQLMASAQRMQADMERAQASLAEARVTGSAGGGVVRAEVNGAGELLSLYIDPSVVDPEDTETLADLVVAAVRDGVRAANDLTRDAMGSVAGELMGGLTLPGMGEMPGLSGFGGELPGAGGGRLSGFPFDQADPDVDDDDDEEDGFEDDDLDDDDEVDGEVDLDEDDQDEAGATTDAPARPGLTGQIIDERPAGGAGPHRD
jgi:DNA-binding YbaB/EbfC family protein